MDEGRTGGRTAGHGPARPVWHGWLLACGTVGAALGTMGVLATAGLWAAGAHRLPDGAFPRVVVAVVSLAVGGDLELTGGAGAFLGGRGELRVLPLSVGLAGALVVGAGFLAPWHRRTVVDGREWAGRAGRIALLWTAALVGLALGARQEFGVPLGDGLLSELGELFGLRPTVGFEADVGGSVLRGLGWLAGVFLVALLVSPRVPVPGRVSRLRSAVRPAAGAALDLLLGYVAVGLVIGVVVAGVRGHPADTFAVVLLGLPDLVWLAFVLGLGVVWDGRVDGPFGLPVPTALDRVLRGGGERELSVRTLAEQDAGFWWLVPIAALALCSAAALAALRSPPGTPLWRLAVRWGLALVVTVAVVCLLVRVDVSFGLSLLGIGDPGGGSSGQVLLRPRWGGALVVAVAWGAVTGLLGGGAARWWRRRGGGPAG
ncbi:streptophobe family protein [Streptomyces sp. NPDC002454]